MKSFLLISMCLLGVSFAAHADVSNKKEVVTCVDSANRPYHLVFETTKLKDRIVAVVSFTSHESHLFGKNLGPWQVEVARFSFKDEATYEQLFKGGFWNAENIEKSRNVDTLVANPDAHYLNIAGSTYYAQGSRGFINVYILGATGRFGSIAMNLVDDQIVQLSGCVWDLSLN